MRPRLGCSIRRLGEWRTVKPVPRGLLEVPDRACCSAHLHSHTEGTQLPQAGATHQSETVTGQLGIQRAQSLELGGGWGMLVAVKAVTCPFLGIRNLP